MTTFETSPVPNFDEVKKTGDKLEELKQMEYIAATVGLADTGKPEWQQETEKIVAADGKDDKPGYNFGVVEQFKEGVVKKYLFDGEISAKKVAVLATHGGSDALSKIVGVLNGPIIPVGMPNWPNTKGIIERKGGVVAPYLDLDTETGAFNHKNAIEVIKNLPELLETMDDQQVQGFLQSQREAFQKTTGVPLDQAGDFAQTWLEAKMVTPLLHAVCKNPTGIDLPEKVGDFSVWEKMADGLLKKDMILILDAAYIGFGEGSEQDNAIIKYFAQKGVKMMVSFSGSKLYNVYGDERIGAIAAVNFDDIDAVKKKILYEGRNTTSAVGTNAQKFAVAVESNPDLSQAHKEWLAERRKNSAKNREIIADALHNPQLTKIIREGRGLFATLGTDFAKMVFPELAEKMGLSVPQNVEKFPENLKRVAGVITPDSGIGDGNIRLNTMQITAEQAGEIGETLRYAEEKIDEGINFKKTG